MGSGGSISLWSPSNKKVNEDQAILQSSYILESVICLRLGPTQLALTEAYPSYSYRKLNCLYFIVTHSHAFILACTTLLALYGQASRAISIG